MARDRSRRWPSEAPFDEDENDEAERPRARSVFGTHRPGEGVASNASSTHLRASLDVARSQQSREVLTQALQLRRIGA